MISSEELKKVLIKYLHLEDITPEEIDDKAPLFGQDGLGLDSVDTIEIILAVEKEFGFKITDTRQYVVIFGSIHNLLNHINAHKK